jgi:hypothetical protein
LTPNELGLCLVAISFLPLTLQKTLLLDQLSLFPTISTRISLSRLFLVLAQKLTLLCFPLEEQRTFPFNAFRLALGLHHPPLLCLLPSAQARRDHMFNSDCP